MTTGLRPIGMTRGRRHLLAVPAVLAAAACSTSGSGTESRTAGFASYAGVVGCADLVAWGTVRAAEPVSDGLEVTFDVAEWIYPSTGSGRVRFVADDPAKEVAAPTWESSERVLVVVSEVAPAARHEAAEGERAVRQWRDAGSPRLRREECEKI